MKTKTNYTQCKLQKNRVFQIAWIPSTFAVVNKYIKIKNDNGWKVIKIFNTISNDEAIEILKYHRTHRKGSDI